MIRKCVQCGKHFEITEEDLEFYMKKDYAMPKSCDSCRGIKKPDQEEAPEEPREKKHHKKFFTIAGSILVMLLLTGFLFWWHDDDNYYRQSVYNQNAVEISE